MSTKMNEKKPEQRIQREKIVTPNQRFTLFDKDKTTSAVEFEDADATVRYSSFAALSIPKFKPLPLIIELSLPQKVHREAHDEELESRVINLIDGDEATTNTMRLEIYSHLPEGINTKGILSSRRKHFTTPFYAALSGIKFVAYFPENGVQEDATGDLSDLKSLSFSLNAPIRGVSSPSQSAFIYVPQDLLKISGISGEFVLSSN